MVTTLADILSTSAMRPDRTALIVGDQHLTFGTLERWSDRVAAGLIELGVCPGDRVSLFGANGLEWAAAYYGAAKAGAVINPLSSMLTNDELRYTVLDAGAQVVIGAADKVSQLQALRDEGVVQHVVLWGHHPADGNNSLTDWIRRDGSAFVVVPRLASDLAVIAYTSGTTGRPKGAMQSHRAVVAATSHGTQYGQCAGSESCSRGRDQAGHYRRAFQDQP